MPSWILLLVLAALLLALFLLKRGGQISAEAAADSLQKGALVIDVRSAGEFAARHLPGALNIPLDEVETATPRGVQDKNQILLLHCQSGLRSAAAQKKLTSLGYACVYNLGSYARAAQIVGSR